MAGVVDFETEFRRVFYIISFCCVGFSIGHILTIFRILHRKSTYDLSSSYLPQRRLLKDNLIVIRLAYYLIFSTFLFSMPRILQINSISIEYYLNEVIVMIMSLFIFSTSYWHMHFCSQQFFYSPNAIKSIDYVYFALGILAVLLKLHTEFAAIKNINIDFLIVYLAINAISLRITKTSCEIFKWHKSD